MDGREETAWLAELQHPGMAVRAASRRVDRLTGAGAAGDPDEVCTAMVRLAQAYEADGDLPTAVMVARSAVSRCPATQGLVANLRARTALARCQRLLGDVEEAMSELWSIVDDHGRAGDRRIWNEVTLARSELVLCLLASGHLEAALEIADRVPDDVVAVDSSIARETLIGACETLAVAARRAGRLATAVRFSQAVLGLLAAQGSDRDADQCRTTTAIVEMLIRLDRLPEASALGEQCHERFRRAEDARTIYRAALAGLASAEASLALRDPQRAQRLLAQMPRVQNPSGPEAEQVAVRLGLVRAGAAMQLSGAGAAMRIYEDMLGTLGESGDLTARRLLAAAIERDGALRLSFGNSEKGVSRAHQLIELWRDYPADPDLIEIADACNRLAEALFTNDQVGVAAELARAVIDRQDELLDGTDPEVCITAYTLLSDALMFTKDPAALSEVWDEILSLGEPALMVLDGLAEHYRRRDDLRVVLLYTYIGRSAVLSDLGRQSDAEQVADELLSEFASDEDEQIQRILRDFRAGQGGGSDE